MKKIININLSGRVLPMEDTAYEKLQAYIESLRRYFVNEEGKDEIIGDIESRIAELLHDKIRKGASAITDDDVEEVVNSMGRVQDFEAADNEDAQEKSSNQKTSGSSSYSYTKENKRLYRDSSDKIIAGVCSGVAAYLGVDPAIVRILFAIITFGGFGLGFLAYIILWIVLPTRDLENTVGKRLYRNPDDSVISGVAGGLAAYFNKSATTIRLIFAAPIILNIVLGVLSWPFFHEGSLVPNFVFGSFTGTFILAYIILWIVLPEAKSDYQKMEMRGEKVDVNRIKQNVQDGIDNMKERMKGWGQEVNESAQNFSARVKEFSNTRGKEFASDFKRETRNAGSGIGNAFGVLFKAFFLIIFGSIAVGLFFGLIALLIGGVDMWPVKNFLIDGFWQNLYGWGTLLLFLGVPLIAFIVWLIRRIMKVKSQNNYLGWTFGGLWTIGWVCVTLFAASMINDFRWRNEKTQGKEMQINQPANSKLIVKVTEPEIEYSGSFSWLLNVNGNGFDINKDTMKYANIRVEEVLPSEDSNYHVIIKKISNGRTIAQANQRADKIQFTATSKDSVLDLSSGIAIDKASKFRGQQVEVIIKVPVGKKIRFDETMQKLHDFRIVVKTKKKKTYNNLDWNWEDNYFIYDYNIDYVMGADGQLKNLDGSSVKENDRQRNMSDKKLEDSLDKEDRNRELQQKVDEEKRKQDDAEREKRESQQRQKDLEEKIKKNKTGAIKKLNRETKDALVGQPSIQLMEWL